MAERGAGPGESRADPYGGRLVELYRTPSARACRERALVLRARGVPFVRTQEAGLHVLLVESSLFEVAARELASYEDENRGWPPRDVIPPAGRGAFAGTAAFAAALLAAHLALALGWLGPDAWDAGASDAARVRAGEVWRAVTSLFEHTGAVHLSSNLVFGLLFGGLVAYGHGGGLGWLAILVGGALGNLTNAWVQPPEHVSVGASTAVFAAIGILAGSEWRRRRLLRQPPLRVAAPIIVALFLLAEHGVPAEPDRTDVLAHVFGLAWGLPLGALLPSLLARGAGGATAQRICGLAALLVVLVSWALALSVSTP